MVKIGSDGGRKRFRWTKTAGWERKDTKLRSILLGKNIEESSRQENKQANKRGGSVENGAVQ